MTPVERQVRLIVRTEAEAVLRRGIVSLAELAPNDEDRKERSRADPAFPMEQESGGGDHPPSAAADQHAIIER